VVRVSHVVRGADVGAVDDSSLRPPVAHGGRERRHAEEDAGSFAQPATRRAARKRLTVNEMDEAYDPGRRTKRAAAGAMVRPAPSSSAISGTML
jgi:hypothetical protein